MSNRYQLTPQAFRWLDRGSKLLGIGLIAIGLEVGGHTVLGIVLALAGVASGLLTVVLQKQ